MQISEAIMERDGTMNLATIIWEENEENNGTFYVHLNYFVDNGSIGVKFLWRLW